ncbi:MAG TPA: aminotransferase [Thiolinea sp.]|nr:aminotransferase [Thiolinea sp.]
MSDHPVSSVQAAAEADRQHHVHPASSIEAVQQSGPRMINRASGNYIYDADGRAVLDGTAGLWCVNIGHGRQEIADTLAREAMALDYFHNFSGMGNPKTALLAERLTQLAPAQLSRVYFGSSGSDANDTIVKMIWHYNNILGRPQKKKILSRWQAYHGTSISAASLTGLPVFHKWFDLPIPQVLHLSCPHYYRFGQQGESEAAYVDRLVAEAEAVIAREGADTIAAFIGEPIMGAGGVIVPPADYWPRMQALMRQHDILMIADEVICGYGRTGEWFASPGFGIEADFMATAKGLTSGIFPMSAVFLTEAIHEVLREGSRQLGNFAHGYTYSGHPLGAAVALTNLDIMERENLCRQAAETGAYLHRQLQAEILPLTHVGEIRGKGLLAAVQLVSDKDSRQAFDPAAKAALRVSEQLWKLGVTLRPLPGVDSIALSPPLTLTRAEVDRVVGMLKQAIETELGR